MTAAALQPLTDRHSRIKRKLRVSLTERCNFRCPYCMPTEPQWRPRSELLSRPELFRLLRLFVAELGISQLRLTGGEPLLRNDLEECIAEFSLLRDAGLERISLSSNGVLLPGRAERLKAAGLDDINVSLDALDTDIFRAMSGGHSSPDAVLAGIEAAREAGLPVKINAVIVRGLNESQVLPLARWTSQARLPLRFIEFMPLDGRGNWTRDRVVPEAELLAELRREFEVAALPRGNEPATYYQLSGQFQVGVISTISNPFCGTCDRLRLTATGELFTCLFAERGHDLTTALRDGASDESLAALIRGHVWNKQKGYQHSGYVERPITMHALGG